MEGETACLHFLPSTSWMNNCTYALQYDIKATVWHGAEAVCVQRLQTILRTAGCARDTPDFIGRFINHKDDYDRVRGDSTGCGLEEIV